MFSVQWEWMGDAGLLEQQLHESGDTRGIMRSKYSLACQPWVCTIKNNKQRTIGTFSDSQLIYSYLKCKYATRCWHSAGKSKLSLCFPSGPGHPLLALVAGHTGPHSNDRLILDQNRHDLAYTLATSHLWSRKLVLFHRIGYILNYIIF